MSNIIRFSESALNKEWISMSNQGTDRFLSTGAISQAQHDKSLHDLREKMGET